jgi:2-desacetyl-2-hydroxyethyl bacteriochlorophyllide A dehydrogenase
MSIDAHAFWVVAPGRGEIRQESPAPPSASDVVVRTLYSGISRGTESLVFHGRVPASEYQRMRAPYQAGDFPAPVKYGYANVGRVEQGPAGLAGRMVFSLYPHQTRFVVPAGAVHVVPDDVPARRAVLAANMETALNAVWDARVVPGQRVVVVGAGAVGCLVARLAAQIPACDVTLVDTNPARAGIARVLGVGFAAPEAAAGDADVVLHASGTGAGLSTALGLAGMEATVVDLSWYGDQPVALPLGGAFHSRRLTIQSSQVGQVARDQRARWSTGRRLEKALQLLNDPALDALLTGETAFSQLPDAMPALTAAAGATICHTVTYD